MKYLIQALFVLAFISCNDKKHYSSYGEIISDEGAVKMNKLASIEPEGPAQIKLTGTVNEVCQMKGCWMTLKNEQGAPVRVTFKDYGFFVPKDISGREVVVRGEIIKTELDEETARHYAEDAGVDFDPEASHVEYALVADGVLVQDL